ncbi:MAG: 2-C-methyl-D-erythritol 2,4-cyclodiphosphate synthase [Candidatus Omnitrophica bacterium]|nr:2-C-methyl-D-erythritol 2,4-cyclodiphosphate synthase [Candidatus Omnitrophota bacterium]
MFRIGIGYDIHRLLRRRKLILGGVQIPFAKGLLGHSDGDVLLHAICDALLGAAGEKDIGEHFPDSSIEFKDISSSELLKKVALILKKSKFVISNIDAIVIAEKPKLSRYKKAMERRVAQNLKLPTSRVNVKATTAEGMGEIGRGKAISAYAIALIKDENI